MFSERLKKLKPYVPGEQPQDRSYIKLNTNENPYPPSPLIKEFLENFDIERLRLYPDPRFTQLRLKIAERYNIPKACTFVSNGSDEILSYAFYAFFDSNNGKLLFPEFTYSFYSVYCDFYGINYERIPLRDDFGIDLNVFSNHENACGIIFPNPNAPTGIYISLATLTTFLDQAPSDRVIVVDEAYIDFGGESAVQLIGDYPNLLVIRTFSKSMSLAGLRLGFAMGAPPLIDALFAVKDSFNSYPADTLAQRIGEIAMDDTAYYDAINQKIMATREDFSKRLTKQGWEVLPSRANFVFAGKPGVPGATVYGKLKESGILVRYFDTPGIRDYVRITIGAPDDMERLLAATAALF